jgi:cytochrome c oxidase subunit 1
LRAPLAHARRKFSSRRVVTQTLKMDAPLSGRARLWMGIPSSGATVGGPTLEFHEKPSGLRRWLFSTNHREIGILYLFTGFFSFFVGGLMAMIVRWELMDAKGETVVYNETYNALMSVHALTMIFLFVMPTFAGFGNYLIPLMIGAKDMAFPRINALSYWFIPPGALLIWSGFLLHAFNVKHGGVPIHPPAGGWTMYVPLNAAQFSPGIGPDLLIIGLQLLGIGSILGALNFIVTIVRMRAPNMTIHQMPLFAWAVLTTSILLAFATPSLTVALFMLLFDRHFGSNFFDFTQGGDVIMWQHLFWFFGHPEVYILILPGMGIISEVIPRMSRKPIFGYHAIAYSTLAIGLLGFMVWVHHMFTTGISLGIRTAFMAMTMAIGIPTGVKVFNWLATMWNGVISFRAPMLFAIGFLSMFVIGGINGVFTASIPVDYQLQDTYWVVSHLHYVLFGGSALAIFAGFYYYFPHFTGRMYNERMAQIHFALTFIGLNMVFFTMHILGTQGMPRRVAVYDPAFEQLNILASIGAFILGLAQLLIPINFFYSKFRGPIANQDPWRAGHNSLEWTHAVKAGTPATPMPYEVQEPTKSSG